MSITLNKKIKYIPTELNFINYTNAQIKLIKNHCTISRLMIIMLLLWNLIMTCSIFHNPQPHLNNKINKHIIIEEQIPDVLPEIQLN